MIIAKLGARLLFLFLADISNFLPVGKYYPVAAGLIYKQLHLNIVALCHTWNVQLIYRKLVSPLI